MSRRRVRVYLVPGFFGFTNFGELKYFAHVKEVLEKACAELGVDAVVERVQTAPTASIPTRAAQLLQAVAASAQDDDAPIHLVGHSTGGLDARLLASPSWLGNKPAAVAPVVARVRSITCVATPHYGSPLAGFFDTAFGAPLLQLLSLLTIVVLRTGRIPVGVLTLVAGLLAKIDDVLGAKPDVLNQIHDLLLADFDDARRKELEAHFVSIGEDRALLTQLTPEGIELFDATTPDRDGVRYGCVVTEAEKPTLLSTLGQGVSPYAQGSHALYHALWHLGARGDFKKAPPLDEAQVRHFVKELGAAPTAKSNDGIVPTQSQIRGELVRAVPADHLDVIGHFDDPGHDPPHYDWIRSGSGFRRHHFDALWRAVAAWILRDSAGSTTA